MLQAGGGHRPRGEEFTLAMETQLLWPGRFIAAKYLQQKPRQYCSRQIQHQPATGFNRPNQCSNQKRHKQRHHKVSFLPEVKQPAAARVFHSVRYPVHQYAAKL